MKETALLTSPLEYTNEPYAIAKIAGLKMCESFNLQYGTNYIAVMPTNLYGPNDNFHLENSHVLPAMVRKIHLGQCLMEGDWNAVRKDLNARPVEQVDGTGEEKRKSWPCWSNTALPPVPWNCGVQELPCASSFGAKRWRTPASM